MRLGAKKGRLNMPNKAPLLAAPSSGCGGNCVVSDWSKDAEIKGKQVSDVRVVVGIGRVSFIPCLCSWKFFFLKKNLFSFSYC
jgi:hypothetical protein